MIDFAQTWRRTRSSISWQPVIVFAILFIGAALGFHASLRWLFLLVAGISGLILFKQTLVGLPALIVAALFLPFEFGTGTAVSINPATLMLPGLLGLWVLRMMLQRSVRLPPSSTTKPLLLFLLAPLFSLLIGNALWDATVPQAANFIVVQISQWAIFVFSGGVFLLVGSEVVDVSLLQRLTFFFLLVVGIATVLYVIPVFTNMVGRFTTASFDRAPFWLLLTAVAGGQLLFNHQLSFRWRVFIIAILSAILFYTLVQQVLLQEKSALSGFLGVATVLAVLTWLRFPRLRWPVSILLVVLALSGVLFPTAYEFAGGDDEWFRSGGARLALIERVVEVTMRNPITGLGPASYRPYANLEPLVYEHIVWLAPRVSSHNNYVDLFAHTGLLGLGLFIWFVVEVGRLALRLRTHFLDGFAAGYVNGMLAAGIGALALMMLADWILPFVYNIGFSGFQASMLVWLFLGGLVSLEQTANTTP